MKQESCRSAVLVGWVLGLVAGGLPAQELALWGPPASYLTEISADPVTPGAVVARTDAGHLYRSEDYGVSWAPSHPAVGGVTIGGTARGIGRRLWAVNAAGVFRSGDNGATWSALPPGGPTCGGNAWLGASPAAPNGLFVRCQNEDSLFWTPNLGRDWFRSALPASIRQLVVDPQTGLGLFAWRESPTDRLVYRPHPFVTWFPLAAPEVVDPTASELFALPGAPPRLILASPIEPPLGSESFGASWAELPWPRRDLDQLVVSRAEPRRQLLSRQRQRQFVFLSEDGGEAWTFVALPFGATIDRPVRADFDADGETIYALTDDAVAHSRPPGPWRASIVAAPYNGFLGLTTFRDHHDRGREILAYRRMWQRTATGGWQALPPLTSFDPTVHAVDVDPRRPGHWFAATSHGVFETSDGGHRWTHLDAVPTQFVAYLGDGTVLAGGCGLRRGLRGGRVWREVYPCQGGRFGYLVRALAADPRHPGGAFLHLQTQLGAASEESLLSSTNGGVRWVRRAGPGALGAFHQVGERPGSLYLATVEGGILRSQDGGRRWEVRGSASLNTGRAAALWVIADPTDPEADQVYLLTDDSHVLWSLDGGRSFGPAVAVPGVTAGALARDPTTKALVVSTNAGLFRFRP